MISKKGLIIAAKCFVLVIVLLNTSGCNPNSVPVNKGDLSDIQSDLKGWVITSDSIVPPETVIAGEPEVTEVIRPNETDAPAGTSPYIRPAILRMLPPVIKIPGKGGLKIPEPVTPSLIPVICRAPEIILVKDPTYKDINPANFAIYNKLQGLRHDQVREMKQDSMGNIWLATDDGLIRYDGRYFYRYSTLQGFNNNLFLTVSIDNEGTIWAGTYGGGVAIYDGSTIKFITAEEGLPGNNVNRIYTDSRGIVWIGTSAGLSKYDGKELTSFTTGEGLCHNDVRTICEDLRGNVWIGTFGGGFSVFDGTTFTNYSEDQGLMHNYIASIFCDKAGNMWIGSAGRGLLKYDGKEFSLFTQKHGFAGNSFYSIMQDKSGNLWFGSNESGLTMFNGEFYTYYSEKEGLSSNIIRCGLSDRDGDLWFGTRGGGFVRFKGDVFTHLTSTDGLGNSRVMAVIEDKQGDMWFGTFGGYVTRLSRREEGGITRKYYSQYGENAGLKVPIIYDLEADSSGTIWIASDGGGVSAFDGKYMRTYTTDQGLCGNYLRDIYTDRDGKMWFSTYGNGVSKFDGTSFTNFDVNQGLGSNLVMCAFQDSKGVYWFGTADMGLTKFDGTTFTRFSTEEGFFSNTVYSITEDHEGNVWFGTGGAGAVTWDGKGFSRSTATPGQNESHVLALLAGPDKSIWIGTRFGIIEYIPGNYVNGSADIQERSIAYDFYDGFTGIGCNHGAIARSKDGTIWIGTTDRLTLYNPQKWNNEGHSPGILINEIRLFNDVIPWAEVPGNGDTTLFLANGVPVNDMKYGGLMKWFGQPENLSLRYNNNYLTFSYVAIELSGNQKTKYQYMLEGIDDKWNSPTNRTEVSYGNLKPGNYTFRVKAISREGLASEELQYGFTIRPPWWKTVWFYLFVAIISVLSVLGYIQLRLRKLQRDKEILERRVSEQTSEIIKKNSELELKNKELEKLNSEKDRLFSVISHDLRGPFGIFLGFTEHISSELPRISMDELSDLVMRMNNSATDLFRLLENLLHWSLVQRGHINCNPEPINLFDLVNDSVSVLNNQAKTKEVEIIVGIPGDMIIKADTAMLQSVIRNLVSNAVKFSHPGGRVIIMAKKDKEGKTEVSVADNGIGMNSDILNKLFQLSPDTKRKGTSGELSTGLGLIVCREFVEIHGGKIRAESTEGKGSVFYFTV